MSLLIWAFTMASSLMVFGSPSFTNFASQMYPTESGCDDGKQESDDTLPLLGGRLHLGKRLAEGGRYRDLCSSDVSFSDL
jgi:hypothetical protein